MIVEIPDENSIIKWKYKDTDDWTTAEVSDLIKAYEERRPKGEWVEKKETRASVSYYCFNCKRGGIPITPFCPWCGADLRGKKNE